MKCPELIANRSTNVKCQTATTDISKTDGETNVLQNLTVVDILCTNFCQNVGGNVSK